MGINIIMYTGSSVYLYTVYLLMMLEDLNTNATIKLLHCSWLQLRIQLTTSTTNYQLSTTTITITTTNCQQSTTTMTITTTNYQLTFHRAVVCEEL